VSHQLVGFCLLNIQLSHFFLMWLLLGKVVGQEDDPTKVYD
jgi:hypothetical protein